MSKENFASLVCSKIRSAVGTDGTKYSSASAIEAGQAVANAISEYLTENVTVTVSYAGTLAKGGSDPVVTDVFKISGSCSPLSVPEDFASWVKDIQQIIADTFVNVSPGTAGLVATFKPFSPSSGSLSISQSALKAAHESNVNDPMQKTWEIVCGFLMDWINSSSSINPLTKGVSATRSGKSSGTLSVTKITVV